MGIYENLQKASRKAGFFEHSFRFFFVTFARIFDMVACGLVYI